MIKIGLQHDFLPEEIEERKGHNRNYIVESKYE